MVIIMLVYLSFEDLRRILVFMTAIIMIMKMMRFIPCLMVIKNMTQM